MVKLNCCELQTELRTPSRTLMGFKGSCEQRRIDLCEGDFANLPRWIQEVHNPIPHRCRRMHMRHSIWRPLGKVFIFNSICR